MRCSSFLSIILLFSAINFPFVISDFISSTCKSESLYTYGSTYAANLKRVMSDLIRNAPQSSGFNTSSFGQTPNKVYGILQCLGKVSAEICSRCAQQAQISIRNHCLNNMGALVFMDDCFLRYDNYDFISILDANEYDTVANPSYFTGFAEPFEAATSGLLSNLCNQAYDPANKLFAKGSANYSTSENVYGLAQCWRDISIKDCRTCLFNAMKAIQNYYGKQGARALLGSCTVRFEIYRFFNGAGQTKSKKKSSDKLPKIIIGVLVGLLLAFGVICIIVNSASVSSATFEGPVTLVTRNEEMKAYIPESGPLIHKEQHFIVSLEALVEATQNFHENNKLGEGGFGPVYRGIARDGKEIAVKKLSARSSQGKKEFRNEVKLMANLDNRNLVKLLGCCAEGDERLLVYEYFPNKSLDTFLFDPEKCKQLDWQKRYNIIFGIARGLLYLHEDSQLKIIHRDIKASNIMLDDGLKPKIADFGLARLFPEDTTQIQTMVAGTYGYMAPEYAMGGRLSVKADVYSFGVLLLEIVYRRKITEPNLPHEKKNLLEWAWRLYKGGDVLTMIELAVVESCLQEQVARCIQIGLLCVQADPTVRPAMWKVIMMISNTSMTLPNPTRPWFVSASESSLGIDLGFTSQHVHCNKCFAPCLHSSILTEELPSERTPGSSYPCPHGICTCMPVNSTNVPTYV